MTETECALKSKTLSDGLNNVYEKPEYPISFIVGTGGANFTKNDVNMFFTEKVVHEHGFVDLHAHNATHIFGRFIDAVNGDRFLDSFWIIRENHSDDALKDNESHTAAIFFIVLVFLAVIATIWYWYYKKNGGTGTISDGIREFSSSVKNRFQSARWRFASSSSDARTNQLFQVFPEEDEGNNEFAMTDSLSAYVAPKTLRESHELKEHEKNDGVDGVDEEEASQTNNPFNNPFENLNV